MLTEQDVRRIYRDAQHGKANPQDVIDLINLWHTTEFELDCATVERDELKKAIEAKGYQVNGPSLSPTLRQTAVCAPDEAAHA